MKLSYILNVFYISVLILGISFGAEGGHCSDEELMECVSRVLTNDLMIKGNFNLTAEEEKKFSESVHQLSEALKKCKLENTTRKYFSEMMFQKIYQLSSYDSMKKINLTRAKIYRIVFVVLRCRAIELQQMKLESSETYAKILINIYNLLIDHLIEIFSMKNSAQSNMSPILNIREVALYIIFVINFMQLEFLGFEPISDQVRGNQSLNIPKLITLFSMQLARAGGIPVREAHGILKSLSESMGISLLLENNPVGIYAMQGRNNIILLALNWFKEYFRQEDENTWRDPLLDQHSWNNSNLTTRQGIEAFNSPDRMFFNNTKRR